MRPAPKQMTFTPSGRENHRGHAIVGLVIIALVHASPVSADPTPGHDAKLNTQTPQMLCEIGSDDADPRVGPNVVCQGRFAQAPESDQAVVTASGQFRYRSANIGVGYPHPPFDTVSPGQTYRIQGWTVAADRTGIRFANDDTKHGMFIAVDTTVRPF